jgi:hypothetical protein
MGLGSTNGKFELAIPGPEGSTSPGAHIKREKEEGNFHSVTVEVRRLDDYFSEHAGRPISFIKCDVEGYELDVFKGAEYILREDRPTLLFECEARHLSNINMADVFSYLTNLGYEGFFFFKNKLLPISHFSTNQHQPELTKEPKRLEYWNNFLFIPKNTNDNTL